MMWYWGGGVHWWGWLLGFFAMIAFWGLVVWGIWYAVTGHTRRYEQPEQPVDVKRVLDERLARGAIGAEEYRRLLDLIRGGPTSDADRRPPVETPGPR